MTDNRSAAHPTAALGVKRSTDRVHRRAYRTSSQVPERNCSIISAGAAIRGLAHYVLVANEVGPWRRDLHSNARCVSSTGRAPQTRAPSKPMQAACFRVWSESVDSITRTAQPESSHLTSLSCVFVSKSLASWRSCSCRAGSPTARLTIRPRLTAGRSAIAFVQRTT